MPGLVVSTIVFFVASYLIKRRMDESDLPKGLTRNVLVFSLALAVSYGAAVLVDWLTK
jgi:hypothetical protein